MKNLVLCLALLFCSTAAFAQDNVLLTMSCKITYVDLDDMKNPDIHDVFTGDVALTGEGAGKFTSYKGHDYYLQLGDLTFDNAAPRLQLSITVRDSKTTALIAGGSAIYSLEVPEIDVQDGAHLVVDCRQKI